MVARRVKIVGVSAGAVALLLAVSLWWFPRLDFFAWDAPPPGTLVAERLAPDSGLVATVRAGPTKGEYLFELRRTIGGGLVARETISVRVGYHLYRTSLPWRACGSRVCDTL